MTPLPLNPRPTAPMPHNRAETTVTAYTHAAMSMPEGLFNDAMDRVAALGELIEQRRLGLLSDKEYAAAKARLFDDAPHRP